MSTQTFDFDVFADYHQFYIQDGQVLPDAPTNWSDEDVQRRTKVAENVVVVCPLRNATVPVQLKVQDVAPQMDVEHIDHAVQCSLHLPSGVLQVHECTGGEVLRHEVSPGHYGVLVEFSGLTSISDDGMDGEDTYRITVWPDEPRPLTVLRCWSAG